MRIKYFLKEPSNINSDAAFNRISLFCKGLKELGVDSDVYLIPHISCSNRCISRLLVLLNYCRILINVLRCSRKEILIFYGESSFFYLYPIIAKLNVLLIELNEYPFFIRSQTPNAPSYSRKTLNYLKFAHGLITCSSFLEEYYKTFLNKNSHIFISSLIVDINSFRPKDESHITENTNQSIVYCGSFNNNKDGVPILIESFSKVHKIYKNYLLYLIGGGDISVENELHQQVRDLGLSESVVFTGLVAHDQLYSYFHKASIFALARPNNKQAEGGIPSKLAEYMAMRHPCVITEVGDLPKLFEKDVDCYMAQPSSVESFTQKLLQCIQSDNTEMVHSAYLKVQRFHYLVQAENLLNFINLNF